MKRVLLFYKYVTISDPEALRAEQLRLCNQLGIKGRILVSQEGVNGTVSGDEDPIQQYKAWFFANPLFTDIVFKEHTTANDAFKKIKIKVRDEIVTLKAGVNITDKRGNYLEPEDMQKLLASNEEYYVIDVRNDYETYIGKFKDSIALPIHNFRELPDGIRAIEHLKKKKVVTVCTGGIRCEKASAYLLKQGFEEVYQLHGGIITYGQKYPDKGYEGKCYVFDERIAVDINTKENKKIIAKCYHCHAACDLYVNCCNAACNLQFVCCNKCKERYQEACSQECQTKSRYTNVRTNS